MAHYWTEQEIKKHEDTVPRRALTQDDIRFLTELQTELNTQNHCHTANPRFWTINEKKFRAVGSVDYANSRVIGAVDYAIKTVEELYNEIVDIKKEIIEDGEHANFDVTFDDNQLTVFSEIGKWTISDLLDDDTDEIVEFFNGDHGCNWDLVYADEGWEIRDDVFFLTQKSATEHLRRNEHNYTENAQTYCCHAYRCPEYEKLLSILSQVDWGKLV